MWITGSKKDSVPFLLLFFPTCLGAKCRNLCFWSRQKDKESYKVSLIIFLVTIPPQRRMVEISGDMYYVTYDESCPLLKREEENKSFLHLMEGSVSHGRRWWFNFLLFAKKSLPFSFAFLFINRNCARGDKESRKKKCQILFPVFEGREKSEIGIDMS